MFIITRLCRSFICQPFVEFLQSRNIRVRSFAPDEVQLHLLVIVMIISIQSNETESQSILGRDLPSEESDDEDFEAGDDLSSGLSNLSQLIIY